MKKVAFVELPIIDRLLPLASGYMEACARKDPAIREAVTFQKVSVVATSSYQKVKDTVLAISADVFAFSCYVWNMGYVRKLIPELLAAQPHARIIIGGPQVIHQGQRYLHPGEERVVLCNGEGERTFTNYLREVLTGAPDFSRVQGLSFVRGAEVITTPDEPRIKDLEEIPSPFLEGLFATGQYAQAVIETNRGCPFRCTYCFWGAATGGKVNQFSEERVLKELEYLAKQRFLHLFVADANWGMLKRDVEMSRFLADCRKRYGAPLAVYASCAKNSKERVQEITHLMAEAGLISTQAIALQTMSAETLKSVKRDNIRGSAYMDLQKNLNEKGINSYLEMIWPLPGETLESFQKGLADLCDMGADSFQVHRLLLMNNVEMNTERVEFELETRPEPDEASEAEFVISTKWVTHPQYLEGVRFVNALTVLYTARGLWALGRYLHTRGKLGYLELLQRFVEYVRTSVPHTAFGRYCEGAIATMGFTHYTHPGQLMHLTLHSERDEFDALLAGFIQQFPFHAEPEVQVLLEADLLNRPYVYRNASITPKVREFKALRVLETLPDGYLVELSAEQRALISEFIPAVGKGPTETFHVNHRRAAMAFSANKPLAENLYYASDASTRMRTMSPEWKPLVRATRKLEGGASPTVGATV